MHITHGHIHITSLDHMCSDLLPAAPSVLFGGENSEYLVALLLPVKEELLLIQSEHLHSYFTPAQKTIVSMGGHFISGRRGVAQTPSPPTTCNIVSDVWREMLCLCWAGVCWSETDDCRLIEESNCPTLPHLGKVVRANDIHWSHGPHLFLIGKVCGACHLGPHTSVHRQHHLITDSGLTSCCNALSSNFRKAVRLSSLVSVCNINWLNPVATHADREDTRREVTSYKHYNQLLC